MEIWKGVIVMNKWVRKIKKAMALLLVWILLVNNTSILNLIAYAQGDEATTESGDDVVLDGESSDDGTVSDEERTVALASVQGNKFSVACIADELNEYDNVVVQAPESAVECEDGWDISACAFPCFFTVWASSADGDETQTIKVQINRLETVLKFNTELDNWWNQEEQKYYVIYGTTEMLNCSAMIQNEVTVEERNITYSVKDVMDADGNGADAEGSQIASISDTGMLTFRDGMVGTIEVKASVTEAGNYLPATVTCQIVVAYEKSREVGLVLKNEYGDNIEDKAAYNHTVYVYPPDGYKISESNSCSGDVWSEKIEISQEGENWKTFYLRNTETSGITNGIEKTIWIDTQIPELFKVEFSQWYGGEKVNDAGGSLEYKEYISDNYALTKDDGKNVKLYYNDAVEMNFTLRGEENEVKSSIFKLHSESGETEAILEWSQEEADSTLWTATYKITAGAGLYYVTLEYRDEANNEFKYRSEYIFIQNSTDMMAVEYSQWKYAESLEDGKEISQYIAGSSKDVKLYYDGSMTMTLKDNNGYRYWMNLYLFKHNNYINEVHREAIVWDNSGKYVHPINSEGEYVINLFGENKWDAKQTFNNALETIVIDQTDPVIKVTYQDTAKAIFEITDTNLNPAALEFKDLYYEDDKMPTVEWSRENEGNVWTTEYEISEDMDGIHQISIKCSDKAGREAEYLSEPIVVDCKPAQWAEEGRVYTEWLTDKDIIGDPDYSIAEDYVAGTNPNLALYFNQDMTITFRIDKKYFVEEYVTVEDSYQEKGEVNLEWEKDGDEDSNIWKAIYMIPETELGKHEISLSYKRPDCDTEDIDWESEEIYIIDTTPPRFEEAVYSGWSIVRDEQGVVQKQIANNSIDDTMHVFACSEVTLNYLLTEANAIDMQNIKVVDIFNETMVELQGINWSNSEGDLKDWHATIPISNQGKHVIVIKYQKDNAEEEEIVSSATIYIDSAEAKLNSVNYSVSSGAMVEIIPEGEGETEPHYYNEDMKIEFVLEEKFFYERDLTITDSYYENSENELSYSITAVDDKYYIACFISVNEEGMHEIKFNYKDEIYNKNVPYKTTIVMDAVPPTDGGILYSDAIELNGEKYYTKDATLSFVIIENNFHREGVALSDLYTRNSDNMIVEYTKADEVEGLERLEYIQDRENPDKWIVRYTIPKEEYGTHEVTLTYNDPCQNGEIVFNADAIIMDEPTGEMEVIYAPNYKYEMTDIDNGRRLYFDASNEDLKVEFVIPEDNFFSQHITFSDSYYESESIELEWNTITDSNGGKVTATYPISRVDEGNHILKLYYDDPLENGDVEYSCELIVDSKPAEIVDVVYSNGVGDEITDDGEVIYYNNLTEAKVSFWINEVGFEAECLCIVNLYDEEEILDIEIEEIESLIMVTCTIPNHKDGKYQLELSYEAKSEIGNVVYKTKTMVVDNTPAKDVGIEYSKWETAEYIVDEGYGDLVEQEDIEDRDDIILYYKSTSEDNDDNVEITFHIKETNFHTEGITLLHNGEQNPNISWSVGNVTPNDTYPVTCFIPKSYEGDHVITLSYHDKCENGEPLTFISKVIRIDNQEAKYKVDYSGWVSAWCVNIESGVGEELLDYKCASRDDVYLYCKEPMILTFDITEKHFCENDVVFSDDYDSGVNSTVLKWKPVEGQADTWRATYEIPEKDGKHIFRLSYQDRSRNEPAINYVSEQIVIDKSKADLSNIIYEGEYHYAEDMADNGKKLESYIIDSRDDVKLYYNSDMTIKFEITEANFYPEDVELIDEYNGNERRKDVVWEPTDEPDKYIIICDIPVEEAGKHIIKLMYQDRTLNGAAISYISEYIIMDEDESVFSEPPVITEWKNAENINTKEILDEYETGSDENNVRLYYNDNMSITFKIKEDNFHESDVMFVDCYNGDENCIILDWQQGTDVESNIWTATYTICKDKEGEHLLTLSYSERSGNEGVEYTSERIMMDAAEPELSGVSFSVWKQAVESNTLTGLSEYEVRQSEDVNLYYDDSMTMTFVIQEANFNKNDVIIRDNGQELPYTLNWQPGTGENSNAWTATHTIQKEGEHVITIQYNDRSGNEMQKYTSETIVIDAHTPIVSLGYREDLSAATVVGDVSYYGDNQVVKICIKEDNFRASDVEITINTEDASTEVDVNAINTYLKNPSNWTETADGYVASIDLDIDAKYDIAVDYTDLAMHASETSTSLVVDKVNPEPIDVGPEVVYNTALCKRMVNSDNATVATADVATRFIYQDAMTFNFVMEEINFNAEDVEVLVFRDGVQLANGDGYQYKYDEHWSAEEENPYIHTLSLEIGKKDGELVDGDYQVKIKYRDLAGHDMCPYISKVITIDHTDPVIIVNYDNQDVNNEIFYNKERVATITVIDRNVVPGEIEVGVTARDIEGNVLAYEVDAKQSPWIAGKEPYTWVSTIAYDIDANYEFEMVCKDMATNADAESDSFAVDKTAPDKESFRFEYSTPVLDGTENDSNNAFYKDKVTVKIIAEDITSPIDYFEWTYIKQPGASIVNQESETHIIYNGDKGFTYDATKRTATVEFTLTAEEAKQYRGNLRFKATDMAGNTSEELTDAEQIVIVDTIAPTRTVEYSPADQIVNKDTLSTLTGFDYSAESVGAALLYNKPMTITVKVNEANFYANDIVVQVNNTARNITNWSKSGDVWTGSISITEDGEYIVTMQYTDRSTNEMVDYTSHMIIVDTVKPQIQVSYEPNVVKQEVEGIKYYDKQLTAIITIVEHNFRAEDVEAIVKATDISGNSIDVMDYATYLKNRNNWERQGDKYVAKITFEKDANYEFDIDYKDLALQPADDYVKDVFTVDQTAPTNFTVSYSAPVLERTLHGTIYEFYREPITVTITAEDEVSGVYSFDYSYIRMSGASSVNAENIINKIEAKKITYSDDKKTATAIFVIPASELQSGTQLNGNMEFVAINRSMLTTEYKDPKCYVVDNIAPNVIVEFNDPVQKSNNISYYAGDVDVTITVDEANFYAEDVIVSISKDGGEKYVADVSWRTISVDRHIGFITLEEEGNYRIYVSYQDPSTNKMEDYQSNLLIIDKTQPEVIVSGIKHNSANKQEQISFIVKVEDLNLDTSSFSPKLTAEIEDEYGNIQQVDCTELGTIETVMDGKSCTYTITNINQDGIYHFSCFVSDMSGNATENLIIEDSQKQIREQLDYSVNRNGSTYGLEENTKKLINSFVKEARDVVIYETNPDEISNIKITLFKNDKTIILEEGKDYIVNLISEEGEWYKYEYIIFSTNFVEDGTYRISIYSEDRAGNIAENNLDVKNVEVSFGVDKTLPNLIVTNLESKTTYPVDKLNVLMRATDNMKLSNITVEVDGKLVASWDEEQIQQISSNLQDFSFDIMGNETKAHTVIITLTDIAGNQLVETISDFYVTRNLWIRFTNNKILFYGSIIACLTTGFLFVLLGKRRKKRNEAKGL